MEEVESARAILEKEKKTLQKERVAMLAERSFLAEKEVKLGSLISALDERESKLQSVLVELEDQKEQWARSTADLQRREALVEDWQKNYANREKRLTELNEVQTKRFADLETREAENGKIAQQNVLLIDEMEDRERKIHAKLELIASSEKEFVEREEKIVHDEIDLKKQTSEIDVQNLDIQTRKQELDLRDTALKERERKYLLDVKRVDDKEEAHTVVENKLRGKENDIDLRLLNIADEETSLALQKESVEERIKAIVAREMSHAKQVKKLQNSENELENKKRELLSFENKLQEKDIQLQNLDRQELELIDKIERHLAIEKDFFSTRTSQIMCRHNNEMNIVEAAISKQMKLIVSFQSETAQARDEIVGRMAHKNVLKQEFGADHDALLDSLRRDIEKLKVTERERTNHAASSLTSPDVSDYDVNSLPLQYAANAQSVNASAFSSQLSATNEILMKLYTPEAPVHLPKKHETLFSPVGSRPSILKNR